MIPEDPPIESIQFGNIIMTIPRDPKSIKLVRNLLDIMEAHYNLGRIDEKPIPAKIPLIAEANEPPKEVIPQKTEIVDPGASLEVSPREETDKKWRFEEVNKIHAKQLPQIKVGRFEFTQKFDVVEIRNPVGYTVCAKIGDIRTLAGFFNQNRYGDDFQSAVRHLRYGKKYFLCSILKVWADFEKELTAGNQANPRGKETAKDKCTPETLGDNTDVHEPEPEPEPKEPDNPTPQPETVIPEKPLVALDTPCQVCKTNSYEFIRHQGNRWGNFDTYRCNKCGMKRAIPVPQNPQEGNKNGMSPKTKKLNDMVINMGL